MKTVVFRTILLIVFVSALLGIIGYTRGYRLNVQKKEITPTGILVASSFPNGAKVYVDGVLKGATDTNVQLPPGSYTIEIKKEGYIPWKRKMTVRGEIVAKTDSLLFPQNPSLSPVTSLGVVQSFFSPNTNEIILVSQNDDPTQNGIYVLETSKKTLSIFNPLKQLVSKSLLDSTIDYTTAKASFSPDGKQMMLDAFTTSLPPIEVVYLLSTQDPTTQPLLITKSKETIQDAWNKEEDKQIAKILETYKDPVAHIATDSFKIISTSPDDSKILYQASNSATIARVIDPPLIGSNQTPEQRTITKNHLYVYDKKEDKNFEITLQDEKNNIKITNVNSQMFTDLTSTILWYPDSSHLIVNEGTQISIMNYDGGDRQVVYSGPYEKNFLGVSLDGNLLILANLNPNKNKYPDVYTVGIR